jgi:hypothetical protein
LTKARPIGAVMPFRRMVKDVTGFSICYVYARKDEALRGSYMTHAEALNSETAGLTTFLRLTGLTAAVEV